VTDFDLGAALAIPSSQAGEDLQMSDGLSKEDSHEQANGDAQNGREAAATEEGSEGQEGRGESRRQPSKRSNSIFAVLPLLDSPESSASISLKT
jgi:hypothetical protein